MKASQNEQHFEPFALQSSHPGPLTATEMFLEHLKTFGIFNDASQCIQFTHHGVPMAGQILTRRAQRHVPSNK